MALSGDLTILAQLCVEGREVKLAGDLLRLWNRWNSLSL